MFRKVMVVGGLVLSLGAMTACGKGGGEESSAVAEKTPKAAEKHADKPADKPADKAPAHAAATAGGEAKEGAHAGPVLTAAPGAGMEAPAVPTTNSNPPSVAEWQAAQAVNTVGANAAAHDCSMKVVREWLKVNCTGKIKEVTNMEGFGKKDFDYFESVKPPGMADFVVRMKKGGSLKMRILRDGAAGASLFMNWPSQNEKPSIIALQTFSG